MPPLAASRHGRHLRGATTLALAGLLAGALAPPAAQAAPQPAAASSYDNTRLSAKIRDLRQAGAVGVLVDVRGPQGTYRARAGYANSVTRRRASTADHYNIASVTKTMVATLVMKEIEAGRWTLQTRVKDVYPGLYPDAERRNVTVGQLLGHRSGMPNHTELMPHTAGWYSRTYDDTLLIRYAARGGWLFSPGTGAAYSNTGYVTLGKMLERSTGKSLRGLLQYRVFKPAGMTESRLNRTTRMTPSAFHEHLRSGSKTYRVDVNPSFLSASGGIESTTADVQRFYKALFAGRLVSKRTLDQMITERTSSGDMRGYGLGIYAMRDWCGGTATNPKLLYGHDGASIGTRNLAFISEDGRRQVNVVWSGRGPDEDALEQPAYALLDEAMRQTCGVAAGSTDGPATDAPVVERPALDLLETP